MSSTFGSFNTVRLGIYAAQKGLDVTGNNITNINTAGYTRQRLDQVSLITSASDRYYSPYKTRVGQGVLTTGVSQLRDPGLDIAYRNASADVGAADAKLAGLEKLASILDEVGKGDGEQDDGVLLNQLNDLRDLINNTADAAHRRKLYPAVHPLLQQTCFVDRLVHLLDGQPAVLQRLF